MTIKEACIEMGVSERTLRRWVKSKKVQAEQVQGAYGLEWRISVDSLTTAKQILDVVKVERPTDPMTLALTVAKAVSESVEESQRPVIEELKQLRQDVHDMQGQLAAVLGKPVQKRVPWWQFWRGSNNETDETGEAVSASS